MHERDDIDELPPGASRPHRQTLIFPINGVGVATGMRLPPETRFWTWSCNGGGQLQFRYGSTVVLSEVLGVGTISPIHVYPGDGCYIEFTAPAGSTVIVAWTW